MGADNPYIEFPRQIPFVVERGAIPSLKLQFSPNLRGLERPIQGGPYHLWRSFSQVTIGGVDFPVLGTEDVQIPGGKFEGEAAFEVSLSCPLRRSLVEGVERNRVNNVALQVRLGLILAKPGGPPWRTSQTATDTIPESAWVAVLEQAGYRAQWTLFVERPAIEGWQIVAAHLKSAHEKLVARDPKGTLINCREALRAARPLLKASWSDIAGVIDSGRISTSKFDPKSARVDTIFEDVLYFVDSAGHAEDNGEPSIRDAEVGYGLTADVMSFLSRTQSQVQKT